MAVNTANLVAYYKLDDDATDSHSTHNGIEFGETYGAAVINNGLTAGYIEIADHADFDFSGAFSISCWYHDSGQAGDDAIIAKRGAAGAARWFISYATESDDTRFYSYGEGADIVHSVGVLDDGEWHHIVVTRDASNDWVLYVDNVLKDTATNARDFTGTDKVSFGALEGGIVNSDVGVDEVGIWKGHALTVPEVAELWNEGNGLAYPFAVETNMKINISDVFKDVSEIKINIGDVWKAVTKIQINIGDAWKTVFG